MDFEKVIKDRYSVRKFEDKMISDEDLSKIMEAGLLAPTAKNIQPQRIFILKSKENIEKINKLSKCIYGAPVVLMCCYDKSVSWKNIYTNDDAGVEDTTIACTQMMLEAWNLGIGSCWVNLYNPIELKREFNLDENIIPVCLLPIGYISNKSIPSPMHFESISKNEMYSIL